MKVGDRVRVTNRKNKEKFLIGIVAKVIGDCFVRVDLDHPKVSKLFPVKLVTVIGENENPSWEAVWDLGTDEE